MSMTHHSCSAVLHEGNETLGGFAARLHGGRAEGHAAADIEAGQVAQVRRSSVHGRVCQAAAAVQAQRRQLWAQARDRHHPRIAHLHVTSRPDVTPVRARYRASLTLQASTECPLSPSWRSPHQVLD